MTSNNLTYYTADVAARDARIRRLICAFSIFLAVGLTAWAISFYVRTTFGIQQTLGTDFSLFEVYFQLFLFPLSFLAAAFITYIYLRANAGKFALRGVLILCSACLLLSAIFQGTNIGNPRLNSIVAGLGSPLHLRTSSLTHFCGIVGSSLMMFAFPALLWTTLARPATTTRVLIRNLNFWLFGIILIAILAGLQWAAAFNLYVRNVPSLNAPLFKSFSLFVTVSSSLARNVLNYPLIILAGLASIASLTRHPAARRALLAVCIFIIGLSVLSFMTQLANLAEEIIQNYRAKVAAGFLLNTSFTIASYQLLQFSFEISPALCTFLFLFRPDIARLFTKSPTKI